MVRSIIILLAFMCVPREAAAQEHPMTRADHLHFEVWGVAPDDVLNIRSGPGADYEIVARLRHDTPLVEIVGVSENERWAFVYATTETMGWTSLHFLRAVTPIMYRGSNVPIGLHCAGSYPFWNASLGAREATLFRLLFAEETREVEIFAIDSVQRFRDPNTVVLLNGDGRGAAFDIRRSGDACFDQAGIAAPWQITIYQSGSTLEGCCALAN